MGSPRCSPTTVALAITLSAAFLAACSASDAGDVGVEADSPADGGLSVEPEALRLGEVVTVDDFDGLDASVSPDGRWFAYELDREICLAEVAGDAQVCEPYPTMVGRLDWDPSSNRVIVSPRPEVVFTSGPVVMIATDGSSEVLVEPPPSDDAGGRSIEGPYGASFLPDGTVVYNEALEGWSDEAAFRLMHLTPDGTEELADYRTFRSTDDDRLWPFIEIVSGTGVFVQVDYGRSDSGHRAELHRFDLVDRSFERIEDDSIVYGDTVRQPQLALSAVSASADHLVMLASEVLAREGVYRDGDPIVFLAALDDGSRVPVPFPVEGYTVAAAVLSPSGSLLAVEAGYGGDDRDVRDSDEGCLLAVVDVSSVMDGNPRWVEPVRGLGRCSGRQLSDRHHGPVWVGETQIVVNGSLGIRRIEVELAQPE